MDNSTNAGVAAQRAAYERRFAELTPDEQEAQNWFIFQARVALLLRESGALDDASVEIEPVVKQEAAE